MKFISALALILINIVTISDEETPDWFLDLKSGKGVAGKGKPTGTPDATLTMKSKDFFDMFEGMKMYIVRSV